VRRGLNKIERLAKRPDFRARPVRALARRLLWRLRWGLSRQPWQVRTAAGFKLWIPKSGSGALIFYQGHSEPETARFLLNSLRPGMTVFDVGAHFGEYTVLAAQSVGPAGRVHAFEPQPELFALLERNVTAAGLGNVTLNCCAVAERDGEAEFWRRREPASSSLAGSAAPDGEVEGVYRVRVCTLDAYSREHRLTPDVIKADVEGAERLVVLGARELCSLPPERAPAWLLEYSPSASARFGDRLEGLWETLEDLGYCWYELRPNGTPAPLRGPHPLDAPTQNLLASKRAWR
jgi:FkbM family methyltransferase